MKTDTFRSHAITALGWPNLYSVEDFLQSMRSLESDCYSKRLKRRAERLRDISSIYASISQTLSPGFLAKNESVRHCHLTFIQEMINYLLNESSEDTVVCFNFCIVVINMSIQQLYSEQEFLDRPLRKKMFSLISMWTSPTEEETQVTQHTLFGTSKKMPRKVNLLEEFGSWLYELACLALASVVRGPFFEDRPICRDDAILRWILSVIRNSKPHIRAAARQVLEELLQSLADSAEMYEIALDACFSSDPLIANGYFLAIVEMYRSDKSFKECPLSVLLNLILYKLGHEDREIRHHSIQLLQVATSRVHQSQEGFEDNWALSYSPNEVDSNIVNIYSKIQIDLSKRLANEFENEAISFFNHLVPRLAMATTFHQKRMLSYAIPWFRKIQLDSLRSSVICEFLNNLFCVNQKYLSNHPQSIEDLWKTLAANEKNIGPMTDFLLSLGCKVQNPEYITCASRIFFSIAEIKAQMVVDNLVAEVSTLSSFRRKFHEGGGGGGLGDADVDADNSIYLKGIEFLLPTVERFILPSRAHIALVVLTDHSFHFSTEFKPHLPVLLHQAILGFDSPSSMVYENCRILLQNFLYSLVLSRLKVKQINESSDERDSELYEDCMDVIEYIASKEGRPFWTREHLSPVKLSIHSAATLNSFVSRYIDVIQRGGFTPQDPKQREIREKWANEAMEWAFRCPVLHWRCRSLQIFRSLKVAPDREKILDLLSTLQKFLNASNPIHQQQQQQHLRQLQLQVQQSQMQLQASSLSSSASLSSALQKPAEQQQQQQQQQLGAMPLQQSASATSSTSTPTSAPAPASTSAATLTSTTTAASTSVSSASTSASSASGSTAASASASVSTIASASASLVSPLNLAQTPALTPTLLSPSSSLLSVSQKLTDQPQSSPASLKSLDAQSQLVSVSQKSADQQPNSQPQSQPPPQSLTQPQPGSQKPTDQIAQMNPSQLLLYQYYHLEQQSKSDSLSEKDKSFGFILEIIQTLLSSVEIMDSNRLMLSNQIFWAGVALLYADFEEEFLGGVSLLLKIIEKIDFNDKAVRGVFQASRPKSQKLKFIGIQPLVLRGLLSQRTEPLSIELLEKIAVLPLNEIFQPDSKRLITSILSLMPWLATNLSDATTLDKCFRVTEKLALACKKDNLDDLSDVFSKVQSTYGTVGMFLEAWGLRFAKAFFPQSGVFTFTFLMELLQQGPQHYQLSILWLFHSLFRHIDMNQPLFTSHFAGWFTCLSQFITGDYWKECIQTLDASISNTPLADNKIDTASLKLCRPAKSPPEFLNVNSEGTQKVSLALEEIMVMTEDRENLKSEHVLSPRAFGKFFSRDDLVDFDDIHFLRQQQKRESLASSDDSGEDEEEEDELTVLHQVRSIIIAVYALLYWF